MQSKAPPRETGKHSQETQPRRELGFWIRRGLVWTIAGLLALAVATQLARNAGRAGRTFVGQHPPRSRRSDARIVVVRRGLCAGDERGD
jgi:hypothetical protein